MWQPGWERSLGENGYMYMYSWVPLLSTWMYHNTVNWRYSNIKWKAKKRIHYVISCSHLLFWQPLKWNTSSLKGLSTIGNQFIWLFCDFSSRTDSKNQFCTSFGFFHGQDGSDVLLWLSTSSMEVKIIFIWFLYNFKNIVNSLAVQGLRLCTFPTRAWGSIPGQGTKIWHAEWHSQIKKKFL